MPVGQTTWYWNCNEAQNPTVMLNGDIGIPLMGDSTHPPPASHCIDNAAYWVVSHDNGHTWGATPSTDIHQISIGTPGTGEMAFVQPSANNLIGLERWNNDPATYPTGRYKLITSMNNGATFSIVDSQLPVVAANPYGTPVHTETQKGPWVGCGNPTSSLCTIFVSEIYKPADNSVHFQYRAFVFDPVQVLSTGPSYLATLTPNTLWEGPISDVYAGYPGVAFSSAKIFDTWWISAVDSRGNTCCSIFEMNGSFTNNTSTLTVSLAGAGSGTVVSGDGNINCGSSCTDTVMNGTDIVLTATPAIGSVFGSWTNCSSPSGNVCTQTVSADVTVTANFNLFIPSVVRRGLIITKGAVVVR
jgi:hypothetical protein